MALSDRIRTRPVAILPVPLLAVCAAFVGYAFLGANRFADVAQKQFFVSRGENFSQIADSLSAQGLLRNRFLFVMVGRLLGGTDRIQVGKYVFASGVTNADLFLTLRSGKGSSLILVGVPEGLRSRSQARLLARTLGIDSSRYIALAHDPDFARSVGVDDSTLEGYLFPDTYAFQWQQGEEEVLRRMVEQFHKFYVDSLREREKDLGWTTRQVLTLASIVEGEAVLEEERAMIAGVYWNRLRRGMKLEADPTIQFIVNERPRRLRYEDLKVDNPYNTYLRPGLPPGPVNNPGRASILAALYPVHHNYLFFVANGRGGHWFAQTYAEHMRNVRQFRRYRAQQQS
jgi:peptidoglycan lytic transglycosylase G